MSPVKQLPSSLALLPMIDFDPYARSGNLDLTPFQRRPSNLTSLPAAHSNSTPNDHRRSVNRADVIRDAFFPLSPRTWTHKTHNHLNNHPHSYSNPKSHAIGSRPSWRIQPGSGFSSGFVKGGSSSGGGTGMSRSGSGTGSGSGSDSGRRGPKGLDVLLSPTEPDVRNGTLPLTPSSSRDDSTPIQLGQASSRPISNILSSSVPASRPVPRTYQTTSAIPRPTPAADASNGRPQKVVAYVPRGGAGGPFGVAPGPKSPGPMMFDFRTTDRSPGLAPTTSASLSSPPAGLSLLSQRLKDESVSSSTSGLRKDSVSSSTAAASDLPRTRAPKLRARAMSVTMKIKGEVGASDEYDDDDMDEGAIIGSTAVGTGSGGIKGKRKGMVFKCESCAKVYRHPSCLSKHRWEHSPHWGTSSKLFLSKHQQVQLLEAATILVHLDPKNPANKTPLPEDKSLWPAAVSPPTKPTKMPHRPSFSQALGKPAVSPYTPASSLPDRSALGRKTSPGADSSSSTESSASDRAQSEDPSVSGSGSSNGHYPQGASDSPAKAGNALHLYRRPSEGGTQVMPVASGPARTNLPPRQSFGSPPVGYHPYTRMGSLPDLGLAGFHIGSASPRTYPSGLSTTPTGASSGGATYLPSYGIGQGSYASPALGLPQSSLRGGIEEGDEDMSANEDEDERPVRDMSVDASEKDEWDQADGMEMDE